MNAFDKAMNLLDDKYPFLASTKLIVSSTNEEDKVQMPFFSSFSVVKKVLSTMFTG